MSQVAGRVYSESFSFIAFCYVERDFTAALYQISLDTQERITLIKLKVYVQSKIIGKKVSIYEPSFAQNTRIPDNTVSTAQKKTGFRLPGNILSPNLKSVKKLYTSDTVTS